jgi:hypothetical protein
MKARSLLSEIDEFARKNQLSILIKTSPILTKVYRRDFGYIKSPKLRFYRHTDKGMETVEKQMESSKSETPAASTAGVFVVTTEPAVSGGSATQALFE